MYEKKIGHRDAPASKKNADKIKVSSIPHIPHQLLQWMINDNHQHHHHHPFTFFSQCISRSRCYIHIIFSCFSIIFLCVTGWCSKTLALSYNTQYITIHNNYFGSKLLIQLLRVNSNKYTYAGI